MRSEREGAWGNLQLEKSTLFASADCTFRCETPAVCGHGKRDPPPLGLATSVALGLFCEPLIEHAAGDRIRAGQLQLGGVVLPTVAVFLRDGYRLAQLLGGKPAGGANFTVVMDNGLVLIHGHSVADHERAWERPYVTHAVLGAESVQAGLFVDFTGDGLFKVFTRVDEPCDEGETIGVPLAVIGQQYAFAVAAHDQAHDGRFDAGKDHFAGCGAADSPATDGGFFTSVGGVPHFDEVVAAGQGYGVAGAAERVAVHRVVAESAGGGLHGSLRTVRFGGIELLGDGLKGVVLAVEGVYLCPAILLRVSAVSGRANHAAHQDSVLSQRLGSIATGQVVQGSIIVEEGFPFAGDEQVARCVSVSGRVFR